METEKKEVKTLMEGLLEEMNRVRELIIEYRSIGPPGIFGATMMEMVIKRAERCISNGDTIEMLRSYEELKGYEN